MSRTARINRADRRHFLRRTALLGAAGTLPALVACAPVEPLRIMVHEWPGYVFLRQAVREGQVSPDEVDLVLQTSLSGSVNALLRGEVDGAALTLDTVLFLLSRKVDVVVVLLFNVSAGGDALLAKTRFNRISDLAGARIGVEDTALGTVMLNRALGEGGLRRQDVEVVAFGDDAVSAWERENLDAIVTYQPALETLRRRGLSLLFDSRQMPFEIVDVLAIRRDVLRRKSAALRRLIAAHFDVKRRWSADSLNTNYRLASLLQIDVHDVHAVFRGLNLPDIQFNQHYLTAPAADLTQAAATLSRILTEEGLLQEPPSTRALFTPDYLPAASP